MPSDPNDFTDMYNTPLTTQQERDYQVWFNKLPTKLRSTYDYDLRGAYLSGAKEAANGHLTDQFKKPNHPTFSTRSQYSGRDGYTGGEWQGDDKAGWTYTASPTNLQFHPLNQLQQYFRDVEPGSQLLLAPTAPVVHP